MIRFGLYRGRPDIKLCHIYVPDYLSNTETLDLCGTNMTSFIKSATSLDDVSGHKICEKCKLVYIMLELAE